MMKHTILIGVSIIWIIALIVYKDYIHIFGWICCLLITVSDWYRKEQIKSLEETIFLLRRGVTPLEITTHKL